MTERVPITAMIASRNEASLLPRCLASVAFCDEVLVIDIDSTDETVSVAERLGARVVRHRRVAIAEHARVELASDARHDWLLFVDPDEVVSPELARQLADVVATSAPDVAVVAVPWRFRFRGRPLRGTVWGEVTRKQVLVRRGAVDLQTRVHSRPALHPGFRAVTIEFDGANALEHYWATGWVSLIARHVGYLKLEAKDRADAGLVTGLSDIASTPARSFVTSFVTRRGYRDGARGLGLSALWAAYTTGAKVALLRELRRREQDG